MSDAAIEPDAEALAADAEARAQALDGARSFIVQAPAGSGKTGLLIQRYLVLLARADAPEQILAITFTRKAAAQMRQRILDAIRQAAQPPPEAEFARRTWALAVAVAARDRQRDWRLLRRTERLRVQTIDSFCQSLVRRYPLRARLPAGAQPVEDADELHREACAALFTHLDDDGPVGDALSWLLLHVDNDWAYLRDVLLNLLARREQWLRPLITADRDDLEQGLRQFAARELSLLHQAFPGPPLQTLTAVAMALAGTPSGQAAAAPLAAVTRAPGADLDSLPIWQALACWLTTRSTQTWVKRLGKSQGFTDDAKAEKAQVSAALAALRKTPGLDRRLAATQTLPPLCYSEAQWDLIAALQVVLPLAVAELQLVFQRCGQVDFTELQLAAQRVLGTVDEPSELALHLDYRLNHVLVDEFQDTSAAQAALLETLTGGWTAGDGRTLFLVGDPMQSIYRFRQAEVALFLQAQQGWFGQTPLTALRLRRNFRSAAGLVDWVNRAFDQALPAQADSACAAVPYAAAVAARSAEADAGLPVVHHHAFAAEPAAEVGADAALALEAQRICQQVRRHRQQGARSIAILVRSRGQLPMITEALSQAGLRVSATDIHAVADHPAVLELRAMTLALTDRYDRIAWLSLLRAPWCGLSLPDLTRLVENAQGALDADTPIWTLLNDAEAAARLSDDGRQRLRRFRAVVAQALPQVGRMPLTALVHWLWRALGAAALCDQRGRRIAELFFRTLSDQESGYGLPDRFRLDRALARIHEPPDPQADGGVQIMTLHKSKGLEFDVVMLPDLARQPRRGAAALLRWTDYRDAAGRSQLLLAPASARGGEPDPIYALIQRLESRREDFESARLLYVGCTRARQHLHVFCQVRRRKQDGALTPKSAQGLARHVWPTEAAAFAAQCEAATGAADALPPAALLRRAPAAWTPAFAPPPLPVLSPDGRGARRPDYAWAGDAARHVGTVIHRLLQAIAEQGLAAWDERRLAQQSASIRAQLRALGVTRAGLDDAQRRVTRALRHALTDPRGRWVLGDHRDAHCEWRLSGLDAGQWTQRIIDRSFVDEAGQRWIIDYKTGAHEGGDLSAFLQEERERYAEQLQSYRRLLLKLEDRPVRAALYFPMAPAFLELA